MISENVRSIFFFFNDTATTEIYTLSLHDALPISYRRPRPAEPAGAGVLMATILHLIKSADAALARRSEEHTSELQSRLHIVCRPLLEKEKTTNNENNYLACNCHVDH